MAINIVFAIILYNNLYFTEKRKIGRLEYFIDGCHFHLTANDNVISANFITGKIEMIMANSDLNVSLEPV